MNVYIIQVETGTEERFIALVRATPELSSSDIPEFNLLWPRRNLTIRKRGRRIRTNQPLFPGYLILESETISEPLYRGFRRTPGFYRFLRGNHDIVALEGTQKEMIRRLLSFGEVVSQSKAYFDVNNRIHVTEGPLKGLEGCIVKVNRRKGRAKVRMDLYEDSFLVDLGFEVMEASAT